VSWICSFTVLPAHENKRDQQETNNTHNNEWIQEEAKQKQEVECLWYCSGDDAVFRSAVKEKSEGTILLEQQCHKYLRLRVWVLPVPFMFTILYLKSTPIVCRSFSRNNIYNKTFSFTQRQRTPNNYTKALLSLKYQEHVVTRASKEQRRVLLLFQDIEKGH
jgi:hypothetical protein